MESESHDSPSIANTSLAPTIKDASQLLEQHADVRDSVQQRGPSRGFAWFQLWAGLMTPIYIAVFLFAFSADAGTAGENNPGNFSQTSLLIVPILAFSALATGARERFGIRTALPRLIWIPLGVALLGMFVLSGLSVFDVLYPSWLIVLVALTVLIPLVAPAIVQLVRAPTPQNHAPTAYARLSRPVQITTAIMGAVAGLLVASGTNVIVSMLVMLAALAGIMLAFVLNESPWTLPRAGYEWGWIQWTAFALATSTLFLFAVLNPLSVSVSPAVSVMSGIAVFAIMLVAAALPAAAIEEPVDATPLAAEPAKVPAPAPDAS
ncbi:hypothetical protein ESZ53_02245 [Salinibacterium sp. UTAS2018]|uniref:hypothetical protein n=1 Tax=Salinibacterium sp. UTAS2018 TaxID=2508880 RepID=UPI001009458C|nr:hypothetical protein [Salinibacterium sp. UTAS2018]QAV69363.1 hypothetical protein ESZ53_02245 [Salinibacterium sp. UTAS2018]